MANAVDLLNVGEVYRVTHDARNKGRGVWFSPYVRWKKISDTEVKVIRLGKDSSDRFCVDPIIKTITEFTDIDIIVLEGSEESRRSAAAVMMDPFEEDRAVEGETVFCWIPDRVDKNHGVFEPVFYVGRTRFGMIAIEYMSPPHLTSVDHGMLRMAPQSVSPTMKEA